MAGHWKSIVFVPPARETLAVFSMPHLRGRQRQWDTARSSPIRLSLIHILQAEIEQLTAEKNAHYNEYREKKARVKELHTVKSNLSQILQGEKDREKKHEHER